MANLIPARKARAHTVTVTIANGQTVSTAADLRGHWFAAVIFPATFTGATVGVQGSVDGTNFYDLTDSDGNAISITATDGDLVPVTYTNYLGCNHIKLVSAGAEGGDRTVTVVVYDQIV